MITGYGSHKNQYTHGMKMPRSVASNLLFSETELPKGIPLPTQVVLAGYGLSLAWRRYLILSQAGFKEESGQWPVVFHSDFGAQPKELGKMSPDI